MSVARLATSVLAVATVAWAIAPPLNVPAWDWDPPYVEYCLKVREVRSGPILRSVTAWACDMSRTWCGDACHSISRSDCQKTCLV